MCGDMAGQATAAAVPRDVDGMDRLRLPEVAACALFPQHRVGNRMPQRLQVLRVGRPRVAVDKLAGRVHHAARGVHQAGGYRRDAVGMTGAARFFRVVEISGKREQSGMRACLVGRRGIAGMAHGAIRDAEGVAGAESGHPGRVTVRAAVDAGLRRCRHGDCQRYSPAKCKQQPVGRRFHSAIS